MLDCAENQGTVVGYDHVARDINRAVTDLACDRLIFELRAVCAE